MTADDDLELTVSPDSALIISARDGQILGRGRLRMMVGAEAPTLLVHAPKHAPATVIAPQRGRLDLTLARLVAPRQCTVRLDAPANVKLETLDGDPVDVDGLEFAYGTVIRDRTGQGAWLVRCPPKEASSKVEVSPRPPPRRVELSVEWPSGAALTIDCATQGTAPLSRTVRSGFVQVEAETEGGVVRRWVPAFSDTRLQLPEPKPPRVEPIEEG